MTRDIISYNWADVFLGIGGVYSGADVSHGRESDCNDQPAVCGSIHEL